MAYIYRYIDILVIRCNVMSRDMHYMPLQDCDLRRSCVEIAMLTVRHLTQPVHASCVNVHTIVAEFTAY